MRNNGLASVMLVVFLILGLQNTASAATTAKIMDAFAPRLAAESLYGYRAQFSAAAQSVMRRPGSQTKTQMQYKVIAVTHPNILTTMGKTMSVIRIHLIAYGRYYQDGFIITREHIVDIDPTTGMLRSESTNIASSTLARRYGFPSPSSVAY
jgi:hypothetical protein